MNMLTIHAITRSVSYKHFRFQSLSFSILLQSEKVRPGIEAFNLPYHLVNKHTSTKGAYWLADQEPWYRRRIVFCTVLCPKTSLHTSLDSFTTSSCVTAVRYDYRPLADKRSSKLMEICFIETSWAWLIFISDSDNRHIEACSFPYKRMRLLTRLYGMLL